MKDLGSKEVVRNQKCVGRERLSHPPSQGNYLLYNLKIKTTKQITFLGLQRNVNVNVNQRSDKKK